MKKILSAIVAGIVVLLLFMIFCGPGFAAGDEVPEGMVKTP